MLFLNLMVFILGLCCGSFVNMLVFRTAEGYGLTSLRSRRLWRSPGDCFAALAMTNRRSFCDFCGRQLYWWENVPVLSWLMQKGKSRCCEKKLPREYPIVEMIMGVLFLITNYQLLITNYNGILKIIILFSIVTMLVFSAVFDLKYMILPDFSTVILGVCGLVLIGINWQNPLPYVLAGLGGGVFFLLLHLITKGKGMGMGDVKLAVAMGLLLSWERLILAMYVAFITGAVYGVWVMWRYKKSRKSQIPFGPFLILGTMVAWQFGQNFIKLLITNY